MARNERASTDARHARTGKDGAIFDVEGVLLASVDTFNAQSNFSNAKYSVLGDPQEHETANTFGISISMSSVVVESDIFIQQIVEFMNDPQKIPYWAFQGTILGRNGSEERIVYPECVPSGNIDLQNITVGDVIKRQMNLFCNGKPQLNSLLTLD